MASFDPAFFKEIELQADKFIQETADLVREIMWADGPPVGFTEMTPDQATMIQEELSVLSAQEQRGDRRGTIASDMAQHPVMQEAMDTRTAAAQELAAAEQQRLPTEGFDGIS